MSETKTCPKCGGQLPANAPSGICPICLMQIGLAGGGEAGSSSQIEPTSLAPGFSPPEPEEVAKHFPHLEVLELLGKGGMGAVYKARQPGLDRLVAVKILPPEIGVDPAFAQRFTREARALAKLSHPNIVSVFDFGHTGGLYYFMMEFVDGANLRHVIETGAIKPEEALAIVPQICDALQTAHDEGVVHRDIKPENILVDKQGRVKIADFGLAKLLGKAPAGFTLTGTHQVMGTLHYMAPEQLQGAGAVDHRADIYSLGVVFYEMLTGQLPIGRFEPPSKKVRLDVRLDEVVFRSLESEPSRRYQHASQVKTDVESIACSPASAGDGLTAGARSTSSDRKEVSLLARPWPVRTLLTSLCAFVATFLPWAIERNDMTAWNTHVTVMLGTIPNWTLAIISLVIFALLVLRGLGQYSGKLLIPLLAADAIVHTVYAGIELDDLYKAPGLGVFVSLGAFAIVLISQLPPYLQTAASWSVGFLACSGPVMAAAVFLWQSIFDKHPLSSEIYRDAAIMPSIVIAGILAILLTIARPIHRQLTGLFDELRSGPIKPLLALKCISIIYSALCLTPGLVLIVFHEAHVLGSPAAGVSFQDAVSIAAISAGLNLLVSCSMVVALAIPWGVGRDQSDTVKVR